MEMQKKNNVFGLFTNENVDTRKSERFHEIELKVEEMRKKHEEELLQKEE